MPSQKERQLYGLDMGSQSGYVYKFDFRGEFIILGRTPSEI